MYYCHEKPQLVCVFKYASYIATIVPLCSYAVAVQYTCSNLEVMCMYMHVLGAVSGLLGFW